MAERWTQAEVDVLRAFYPRLGTKRTAQAMGHTRTLLAIDTMVQELGLRRDTPSRQPTSDADRIERLRAINRASIERLRR